jgi:hypothetical protein
MAWWISYGNVVFTNKNFPQITIDASLGIKMKTSDLSDEYIVEIYSDAAGSAIHS